VKSGITGKILTVIRSLYCNIRSCVRLNTKYSDFFPKKARLMHGEALSPFLFSL